MKALKSIAGVRWTSVAALLMLGPVAIVACNEDVTGPPSAAVVQNPPPPQQSAEGNVEVFLEVRLIQSGVKQPIMIDEQLEVVLDGQQRRTLSSGQTAIFDDVAAGMHTLELAGVRAQCQVPAGQTRSIRVEANQTAQASFEVYCTSAPKGPRR